MRVRLKIRFRPKVAADDAFVASIGRRVFARWSRDPARSLASMLSSPRARAEIAEHQGEPIGFAILTFDTLPRRFGPWPSPTIARLDAIAVAPSLEGRGIGKALLAHAESVGRREGGVVMTLMTAGDNLRARRLFASSGFLPLVQLPRSYANGDAAIEMFKLIDPCDPV